MSDLILSSSSVAQTQVIASALAEQCQSGDCIILSGDLGAGKTHFAQGFARGLGVERPVASPTFNIVLHYPEARVALNHFDLYRLDEPSELEDIDFYGLVESEGVSLVEWGEKFAEALAEGALHITIERDAQDGVGERDDCRRIICHPLSQRGEALLAATKRLLDTF